MTGNTVRLSTRRIDPGQIGSRSDAGTVEWAQRWRSAFQSIDRAALAYPERVRELLECGLQYRPWRLLTDAQGRPFPSFEAFCSSPPPHGLGLVPGEFYGYSWRGLARRVWIA